jgi:hypothetical protein
VKKANSRQGEIVSVQQDDQYGLFMVKVRNVVTNISRAETLTSLKEMKASNVVAIGKHSVNTRGRTHSVQKRLRRVDRSKDGRLKCVKLVILVGAGRADSCCGVSTQRGTLINGRRLKIRFGGRTVEACVVHVCLNLDDGYLNPVVEKVRERLKSFRKYCSRSLDPELDENI